jgi:aryl-alcohol dehydrogenase-like predicted oxidoreductase
MEYRRLGRSGLKVSELCVGAMSFGRETDEAEASTIVNRALDAGINFFDTANTYAGYRSEPILGRLLGSKRQDVVIATKFGNPTGPGANDRGASRGHIARAVEDSLKRLGTDYIDLYYVHHIDDNTPLEETVRALDGLVRQGKVRYVACSNFEAWRLLESIWIADHHGLERFTAVQPQYNLLVRDIEDEIVPVAQLKGVGIVPWGPLAGGVLTGKYGDAGSAIAGTRSESGDGFSNRQPFIAQNRAEIIAAVKEVASRNGKTPSQIALRWLLDRPIVSSVIVGMRNAAQFEDQLGAVGWRLSEADTRLLDEVSQPAPRYPKESERWRPRKA